MPVVLGDIMRAKPKTLGELIMETQIQDTVFSTELGALLDAWRLRFGTRWVETDEVDSDAFFKAVTIRLTQAAYLEWHITVGDGAKPVCRLAERW